MTNFKICRICLKFPPAIGGLEHHVYELSKEQSMLGNEVHIVIPYFDTYINGQFKVHVVKIKGIKPTSDESFLIRILVFFKILIFKCLTVPLLFKLNSDYDFDIIHIHGDWFMALFGTILKILLKKHVVMTIHASLEGGLWSKLGKTGVKPFLIIDKIITVSEEIKKQLTDAGVPELKIHVIPSGVRLAQFHRVKKSYIGREDPTIIFIGRIRKVKGVRVLLKALLLILDAFPKARLLIVGDGPSKTELEELSLKMGLKNHVNFVGMVPHHHIPKYLSIADAFVLPSIKTSKEKGEGRPTALIEAMAAGVPVIASNVGGISEIIKHAKNGFLVRPGDYVELADIVIKVLSDPVLASQLGFEASKSAMEYDWQKIAKEVCEVYKEVNNKIRTENRRFARGKS